MPRALYANAWVKVRECGDLEARRSSRSLPRAEVCGEVVVVVVVVRRRGEEEEDKGDKAEAGGA